MPATKKKQPFAAVLPHSNELGFFEMRFDSVGGLGANLAGQLLAQAAILGQGLNGAHFSSYGSEKKGSPVKSFVRLCGPDREVRTNSPVERPHLLAVFHSCLLKIPGTCAGLYPDSVLVLNAPDSLDAARERARLPSGTLCVVNALNIAVEEKTRLNTAMLGAIVKASRFIDPEPVRRAIAASFEDRYPHMVKPNLKTFDRGYLEAESREFPFDGRFQPVPFSRYESELGYANAPIGGIIPNPGNTAAKDLSASRQGIFPLYHRDRCIDCGLCSMTCPDYVFVWDRRVDDNGKATQVLRGPNLQYCKGCLKCVEICPVEALTEECERPEFVFTGDVQLWGPPDALNTMGREGDPAKWEPKEGNYWTRVG